MNTPNRAMIDADADDDYDDGQPKITRRSAGAVANSKPQGARNSVFDVARVAASIARGGLRKPLPALDVSKLVFKTGVAKPPRTAFKRQGNSKYAGLFDRLSVGSSVELPHTYKATLVTLTKKLQTRGKGSYTVQRTSETTITLWRDA